MFDIHDDYLVVLCPTCGHWHPGRIGLVTCSCEDCALLWHENPDLLTPEYAKRREELIQQVEEAHDAEEAHDEQ